MDDFPPPLEIARSVSQHLSEELADGSKNEIVLPRVCAVMCLGLLNAIVETWEGAAGMLN